jgi:beta-lactamase regulating signal transducer with metallopeptidase domain
MNQIRLIPHPSSFQKAGGLAVETFLRVGLGNAVVAGLLAAAAASVGVFARRRPALRHGLWLLVLLKLVTPPLWQVPVTWISKPDPDRVAPVRAPVETVPVVEPVGPVVETAERGPARDGEAVMASAAVVAEPEPVLAESPARLRLPWTMWVLAAWGSGSVLTFAVAAWRVRRFQSLLALAEPAEEATRIEVVALARRLALRVAPEVWQVPAAVSPMLWALGSRPRLILPLELWRRLSAKQRTTLLAHELAHLKRRDHWVRMLELLATGLYWWLPLVWMARHALREAEEQCCDAWVVWTFPDAIRTYAEALLETLDFLSGAGPAATVAVAASGLGPVDHLKRRMTMIMQGTTPRALTWSGLLAVLGLSATLLPLSPTWAQRPNPEEAFFRSLARDHEFNNQDWPFVIKVKDLQDKKLVGATFKHRTPDAEDGETFDMIVEAREARVEFDKDKGVARIFLDGAVVTNPRDDVLVSDQQVLEIPIPSDRELVKGFAFELEDDEAVALDRDQPEKRGRAPRLRGEVNRNTNKSERREVRAFAFSGDADPEKLSDEALAKELEALQKAVAKIKEKLAQSAGEEQREALQNALKKMQDELAHRLDVSRAEAKRRSPQARREGESSERKADIDARRAEVKRLRAEVEERRKALREAEMQLAKATRELARSGEEPGPFRGERFEFRINPPMPARPGAPPAPPTPPLPPGAARMRIVPRPDQDKRIAELEERLEKLQDEVKALKQDEPKERK